MLCHQMPHLIRLWYYTKMNHITQSKCHVISISMLTLLHEILDMYFGFTVIKCKFLYFRKVLKCHEVRKPSVRLLLWRICGMINRLRRRFWFRHWVKKWYWLQIIFGVICLDSIFNGLKIAWKRISMHGPPSAGVAKCASPRKMRGPTQSARAHAKRGGCVMSAGDAKCADARKMRGPRFNCAGRTECAGQNCVERWVGCTAHAPPPHLPLNAHTMQPRFHSRGPRWAAIAWHVKG